MKQILLTDEENHIAYDKVAKCDVIMFELKDWDALLKEIEGG